MVLVFGEKLRTLSRECKAREINLNLICLARFLFFMIRLSLVPKCDTKSCIVVGEQTIIYFRDITNIMNTVDIVNMAAIVGIMVIADIIDIRSIADIANIADMANIMDIAHIVDITAIVNITDVADIWTS